MAGTLFVVATPIGNLEDISARALRVLREVALIAAEDTRRTGQLLARFGIVTRSTSLHEHNEQQKGAGLLARLEAGESIALVSDAGTPTISDPGALLIAAAAAAGVRIESIPGPSAIMVALSASGFAVSGFSFMGFPPKSGSERRVWFERAATASPCLVFYEAPHRIVFTLEDLRRSVGDVQVAVGRELTKLHEEVLRGTISDVLSRLTDPIGEFTVVALIGETAEGERHRNPLGPADALRMFGQLTDSGGLTRRQAVAKLSRQQGVSAKVIYDLIEEAKRSAG